MLTKGWNERSCGRNNIWRVKLVLALLFLSFASASAGDEPCLTCHEELSKEKVVHAALSMGCVTCHSALDVKDVPHKVIGKAPKGLSSEQPELCYGCHDKAGFTNKVVHAALGMGCTACHNPHSSKNSKLLLTDVPALCYGCHDKKKFEDKVVHGPVSVGGCLNCHAPHSSAEEKLLVSRPPDLCYSCHEKKDLIKAQLHMPFAMGLCADCHVPHAAVERFLLRKSANSLCRECHKAQSTGRHITASLRKAPHPVEGKPDPSKPGKEMSCVSCHSPHSADALKLLLQRSICQKCHKY